MSKIVRKTLDECKLTPDGKRKLAEVAQRPDEEIDYSDIPPLTESFWKNAVPGYRTRLNRVVPWKRKST